MAEFSFEKLPEKNLTVISVSGDLTTDEIMAYSKMLHEAGDVSRSLLWDIRMASLAGMSSQDFRIMELKMKDVVKNRINGKTAIVTDSDLSYGFGRLYSTYAEIDSHAVSYGVFRTYGEAEKWLLD